MAPPFTITALLIVLALVPGWIYLRLVERLRPRSVDNALHQLLEVLAVGAVTTGGSALLIALVPHRILPFTLDLDAWVAGGPAYIREHWRSAALSAALVFALAALIAYGLYRLRARKRPPEFQPHGNLWVYGLGERPPGKASWVTLHLEDGRVVEGQLHSYSLDEDPARRDITLSRPIRITAADATEAQALPNLDRLIVTASKIAYITVIHVPAQAEARRAS